MLCYSCSFSSLRLFFYAGKQACSTGTAALYRLDCLKVYFKQILLRVLFFEVLKVIFAHSSPFLPENKAKQYFIYFSLFKIMFLFFVILSFLWAGLMVGACLSEKIWSGRFLGC